MITQIKKDYTDYRKFFILVILSALFLILSFPPFNFSFLAWFALVPLFLIKELPPKKIFVFYYLAGLVFWLCHIWWLNYVTLLGYIVLSAYLALFFGLFGLFLKLFRENTNYPLLFIAPPLWIMFEFIRTYFLIGFPWSLLGYSQWQNTALIQIASITGVYGVSFLLVMLNAAIADVILRKTSRSFLCFAISVLIILTAAARGRNTISTDTGECECQKIKISAVQGNIPQDIKWDREYCEQIVNTYAELSIYAGREHDISLFIWPETSYPDYVKLHRLTAVASLFSGFHSGAEPRTVPNPTWFGTGARVNIHSDLFQKVKNLSYYLDAPLLFGAVTRQNNKDYNSALLISPEGEIRQIYNKLRLVQFAEYVPLKNFLFFLGDIFPQIGNFSKGKEYTIFRIPLTVSRNPSFAVLICFEDLFPDLSRNFANKGASFLVVITNDAHFKQSPALWQHFTHSVFRAVENRRFIVRAANNGISGFIDSYGRAYKILDENGKTSGAQGFATEKITPYNIKTFYTRFGDLFVYTNIIYLFVLSILYTQRLKKL